MSVLLINQGLDWEEPIVEYISKKVLLSKSAPRIVLNLLRNPDTCIYFDPLARIIVG